MANDTAAEARGLSRKITIFKFSFSVLTLLTVMGMYVFFELVARVIIENNRKHLVVSLWQEDNILPQSLKANAESVLENSKSEFSVNVKTTSQGFRDTKVYQVPKPANTFRILMLGDSFTFGHGVEVEQTFSKVLEKSLNEKYGHTGRNFEIVNAGYASGFTWDEYMLFLKERGVYYQPDLVVVNTWVGNDLLELIQHTYPELDEQGLPARITSKTNFVSKNSFLEIKSQTIEIRPGIMGIKDRINVLCYTSVLCEMGVWPVVSSITRTLHRLADPRTAPPPAPPPGVGSYVYQANFLTSYLTPEINTAWETGKTMLVATKKIANDANAKFMIVNIPVKFEVNDRDDISTKLEIDGKDAIIDATRIEKFSFENSIAYCSPLAFLKLKPVESYFGYDSHLTAVGHQLVAEAIENCLLPDSPLN